MVTPTGDLDVDVQERARASIAKARAVEPVLLVADLSDVAFCDSSGLNLLLVGRLDCQAASYRLVLVGVGAQYCRLLEITGADEIFEHAATAEQVLDGQGASGRHDRGEAAGWEFASFPVLYGGQQPSWDDQVLRLPVDGGRQPVKRQLTPLRPAGTRAPVLQNGPGDRSFAIPCPDRGAAGDDRCGGSVRQMELGYGVGVLLWLR